MPDSIAQAAAQWIIQASVLRNHGNHSNRMKPWQQYANNIRTKLYSNIQTSQYAHASIHTHAFDYIRVFIMQHSIYCKSCK